MATRIAINGFGRIGRCVVRALYKRGIKDVELVAINDLTDPKTLAHLLKYDSIHRTFEADVSATATGIRVGDQEIRVTALKDPRELPWKELKSTSSWSAPVSSPPRRRPRVTWLPAPARSSSAPRPPTTTRRS
jgi:glyceraldehyde-3-phosphate dehydrogenase/erythrose-4-phosphate dehydrogenase